MSTNAPGRIRKPPLEERNNSGPRAGTGENANLVWLARNILPLEGEVRRWLARSVRRFSQSDIDDVIQETYSKLLAAELPEVVNPRAYFYRVAKNLVLEQARRSRVVSMELLGDVEALSILSDEPGPERRASAREEVDRLLRAVEALPTQARRVFEMRKFQGLSQKLVAERLGLSQKTVENHLARAVMLVLKVLTDGEVSVAAGGSEAAGDRSMTVSDRRERGRQSN